ncbi:MAG: hypothetical protein ACK4YF_02715 [Exilispira sp.]
MESLAVLLFSYLPVNYLSFYSFSSNYFLQNISFAENYLILVQLDENKIIYRNDRVSAILNLGKIKFILGDFIIVYGFGYLAGYASNSLNIQYFSYPNNIIEFYLSPSASYQSLILKGFYIQKNFSSDFSQFAFFYDFNKENFNFLLKERLSNNLDFLLLFNLFDDFQIIKIGDFKFNNKYQFYYSVNYSFFNFINLSFEEKFYLVENLKYFINYFFICKIYNYFIFRLIHKEVIQTSQYYFSNGNFYQIILKLKNLSLSLYYRDYLYNEKSPEVNFEFYLEDFKLKTERIYLSIYFNVPYYLKSLSSSHFYYSIISDIHIFEKFIINYSFSSSLFNLKIIYNILENQKVIFQFLKNIDRLNSNCFSASQISYYDSYDYYIPANSYAFGLFYFIYLNNFKLGLKVIFSLTDNEINKFYSNFSILFTF